MQFIGACEFDWIKKKKKEESFLSKWSIIFPERMSMSMNLNQMNCVSYLNWILSLFRCRSVSQSAACLRFSSIIVNSFIHFISFIQNNNNNNDLTKIITMMLNKFNVISSSCLSLIEIEKQIFKLKSVERDHWTIYYNHIAHDIYWPDANATFKKKKLN